MDQNPSAAYRNRLANIVDLCERLDDIFERHARRVAPLDSDTRWTED